MRLSNLALIVLLGIAMPSLLAGTAFADIFDSPKNLKVLPDDISSQELGATMRGFALGTGLRCSNCHVGEEGQELTTYDFESDEKELKGTARKMLKMVAAINGKYLDDVAQDHVDVNCVTCHRGVRKPKMLGQVLAEAATENGTEGIRVAYDELKSRYYGSHSYDFTERTLSAFASSQGVAGNMDNAAIALDIMLEENPQSFQALALSGELYFRQGDAEQAGQFWKRALEVNPQASWVEQRLQQLNKPD
jgi:tetratricopeptide (TPR) repeat protein